jgi:hypothetical protein
VRIGDGARVADPALAEYPMDRALGTIDGFAVDSLNTCVEVAFLRPILFEAPVADSPFLAVVAGPFKTTARADFCRIQASDFAFLDRIAVLRAIPEETEHLHGQIYRSIGAVDCESYVTVCP